jgi:hypothetical protein
MYQNSSGNQSGTKKLDPNEKKKIRDLEHRVDKLELVCESLWEIIKEEKSLTETDLIERMSQVDLKDGKFDGKKRRENAAECSNCGRMNSKRHKKCMYCEEIFLVGPFE